jgi:hypothetical protein
MTRTNALRRTLTMATAAVSALALGAAGAGAAASGPAVFSASSEALALDLEVTAPAELVGPLTGGAETIRQKVSFTTALLDSTGEALATTQLLEGLLTEGGLSSADGDTSGSSSIAEQDLGIVRFGLGTVDYLADPAQNISRSRSELARLTVSLESLFSGATLPAEATAPIQDAVDQAVETVNGLVGDLNGALDQVEQVVSDTVGETVEIPEVLPEDLPALPNVMTGHLLDVRKIWSESVTDTTGDTVRSLAHGGIVEASLLDGLIQVPAFQYTSTAATAGTPGTASADTEITTIAVRVGDSEVKVTGSTLQVGDFVLDLEDPDLGGLPANEVLDPVEEILAELLNAGGLSVAQGQGTTEVAEDGSSAKASTSAFALSLAPLHAAGQDDVLRVDLALLPTVAAVTAAPAPAVASSDEPSLPRTGGGALAVLLGSLSIAGAGLLRRRG